MSLNFVKHENLRHRSELPVSISNHQISIIFVLRGGGLGAKMVPKNQNLHLRR